MENVLSIHSFEILVIEATVLSMSISNRHLT